MNDELYRKINNLLSHLRSSQAVGLVNSYYMKFDNAAPAKVMQASIDELQADLDEYAGLRENLLG